MRKKELQLYKPIKELGPPYLTPQELSEFQSQFTLFDRELSVKKLYEAMAAQNFSKTDKLALPFLAELKASSREKVGFEQYIAEMVGYFQRHNTPQTVYDMLGEEQTGQISRKTVVEVLADSLGRDPEPAEVNLALEELRRERGEPRCSIEESDRS